MMKRVPPRDGRISFVPIRGLIFLLIANPALKRWAIFHSSHPALGRRPDEFVHLELKPDIETIGQDPFHDFARIDPTENGEIGEVTNDPAVI
jgi:hypothetical protein